MDKCHLSHPVAACGPAKNLDALYDLALSPSVPSFRTIESQGKRYTVGTNPLGLKDGSIHIGLLDWLAGQYQSVAQELSHRYGSARIALLLGTCDFNAEWSTEMNRQLLKEGTYQEGYTLELQEPGWSARYLARKLGLCGMALTISTACSSSAVCVIRGRDLVESGACDAVIVAATDIAYPLVCQGFDSLGVYSPVPCKPFAKGRRGVTLSSSAAGVIVSRERIADESCLLLGAGETNDAWHITSPDPEGRGAEKAMRKALDEAGIHPGDVGYLNLHGTGTVQNDAMEAKAVSRLFGSRVPASSTKSVTGHTLGSCGVLELDLCMQVLRKGLLPPQRYLDELDEGLEPLGFVEAGKTYAHPRYCLSNAFGFGGSNSALVIGGEA